MSSVAMLARPPSLFDPQEPCHPAGEGRDEGSTLEDLVLGVWEELSSQRPSATCPVCRGVMVARYGTGPAPVGGRCLDCASELA